jgi:hypothetical protein
MLAIELISWLREWQSLIGGLLAFLAACIFAACSVITARSGERRQQRAISSSLSDLRAGDGPEKFAHTVQPFDLVRDLELLRSLIRSALSDLAPGQKTEEARVGLCHQSYERILRMRIEASHLPQTAPKSAHDLLTLLAQNIEALSLLLKTDASAVEISNILIKVNTSARNLLDLLTATPSKATLARP